MLGMKGGNFSGRMDKKKVSVTQVQVKKNSEKALENALEENQAQNTSKEQIQVFQNNQENLINNSYSAYGDMKIKKITAAYKSQAQESLKMREIAQNEDWDD